MKCAEWGWPTCRAMRLLDRFHALRGAEYQLGRRNATRDGADLHVHLHLTKPVQ